MEKTSSILLFLNGCSLLHSQQRQSHHQRWVEEMRRLQDKIGVASNLPMAYDKRTRVVANQHLLARQQRRVEVCGEGKRGSPQMVDTISNAMKQIHTRRTESGTTHWSTLWNGTSEQANIDRTLKGCWSADPAHHSVLHLHARGRHGSRLVMLYRRRLE